MTDMRTCNLNHTVFGLKAVWSFLGLYMCGVVWLLVVTLVEVDVQKVLVE